MITLFLTGAGLAASAGLNAYFPILILALADRTTSIIDLPTPYDWISSNVGLFVILLLLPLELIPDKIARIDHFSDLIHTAIRPGAGALVFMAVVHESEEIHLIFGLLFGLVIAGAVHWLKASSRPGITNTTDGLGNPIISLVEDMLSGALALIAVFFSWGVLLVAPLGFWYLNRMYSRMKSGDSRLMAPFKPVIEGRKSRASEGS